MAPVLDGVRVIDLSWGTAGAVTNMLLADYGAEVIKIEPPGGDPFRTIPGYAVWNRGRQSVVLNLQDEAGSACLAELVAGADVLVESFAPGTLTKLGFDVESELARHPRLIVCSITAYGRKGTSSARPGYDALVQARSGLQYEQPGLRDGPIFLHLQLPSFGVALLAVTGISVALRAREITDRGQWVETSLMQGALLWTTQMWKRASKPNEELVSLWKFRELGPTPCFEASDGAWLHPMPQGVPLALAYVGRDPDSLGPGMMAPDRETRAAYFGALAQMYLQRPRDEWVRLLQQNDVACQPVQPAEAALEHPQLVHNRAVTTIEFPGVGPVTQVGHTYHLEYHDEPPPCPPPGIGEHTDAVLASLPRHATGLCPRRGDVPGSSGSCPGGSPGSRFRHRSGGPVRSDDPGRSGCRRHHDPAVGVCGADRGIDMGVVGEGKALHLCRPEGIGRSANCEQADRLRGRDPLQLADWRGRAPRLRV